MRLSVLARPVAAIALALASLPASAEAHHDNAAEHAADVTAAAAVAEPVPAAATVGDVAVEQPWSRATPPTGNVGAGYLTLRNSGAAPTRFLGASSTAAQRVELHETRIRNDVMEMRHVEGGLEIPAGGTVELAPGGYHLMLIGLAAPLREGGTVPVTLRFEDGETTVDLAVGPMGATAGGHEGHGGH